MFSSSKLSKALLFVLIALIVIVALPDSFKTWAPSFLRPTVHYGLDLAGGTQLDFRISEQELNEQIAVIETKILTAQGEEKIRLQNDLAAIRKQKENVVEAIRTVLERRINSLGVSEARITPSQFGNENHLLVECPGVIDKQKCIDTVGKTIQLEFKEEFTAATAEYEQKIAAQADAVFAEITAGTKTITTASQDLTGDLAVQYQESLPVFEDQLPKELAQLWNRPVGAAPVKVNATVSQARQKSDGGFDIIEVPGVYIAEVVSPKTNTGRIIDSPVEAMKTLDAKQADIAFSDTKTVSVTSLEAGVQDKVKAATPNSFIDASSGDAQSIYYVQSVTPGEETMSVRQILVTYSGSFAGITGITRTKAEALVRAEEAAKAITGGADFAAIAKQYSDDSFAAAGGLQESVKRSEKDAAYANAAFTLPVGAVTPVIETPFGYYIVKAVTAATKAEDAVTFASLQITGADAASTKATSLAALQNKTVSVDAEQMNVRYLFFSKMPTGWKNTALDGKHFRSAVVTLDEFSRPVVQINFNEEGGKLFQQLTKDNIGSESLSLLVVN